MHVEQLLYIYNVLIFIIIHLFLLFSLYILLNESPHEKTNNVVSEQV